LVRAGDPARAEGLLVPVLPGRLLLAVGPARAGHGTLSSRRGPATRFSLGSMQPRGPLSQARRLGTGAGRPAARPDVAAGGRPAGGPPPTRRRETDPRR